MLRGRTPSTATTNVQADPDGVSSSRRKKNNLGDCTF